MDGRDVMKLRIGWNIVVIDHQTGIIEHAKNFNTNSHIYASGKLENFIDDEIKDKRIVLGVVHLDGMARATRRMQMSLVGY